MLAAGELLRLDCINTPAKHAMVAFVRIFWSFVPLTKSIFGDPLLPDWGSSFSGVMTFVVLLDDVSKNCAGIDAKCGKPSR